MKIKEQGETALFENEEYVITRVFNHGGTIWFIMI